MVYAGKRKCKVLMVDAKQEILKRLQKGEKLSLLIAEFKSRKATISDIKKNKEQILAYISTTETSSGAKKDNTLKKQLHEDVEKAMYLWFLQECSRGTPIS